MRSPPLWPIPLALLALGPSPLALAGGYQLGRSTPRSAAPALPDRPYDVLSYDLSLDLDTDARALQGEATLRIQATAPTDVIELDLDGLELSRSVRVDGAPANATLVSPGGALTVELPEAIDVDGVVEINVAYGGTPTLSDDRLGLSIRPRGGSGITEEVAYTMTEPDGSKRWFPCNDTPADKASFRLTVTVPDAGDDTWVVASNGLLVDEGERVLTLASGETTAGYAYTWEEAHPIAPYLMAFAAGPYVVFPPDDDGGAPVPITFFARPGYQSTARVQWGAVGAQMVAFEDLFGPYPFDKYGTVEAPMPFAAMEHQTITLWQTELLSTGYDGYEEVAGHELAHHWFGDMVTPQTWDDIWLNEGFASYAEALWAEDQRGAEGLTEAMGTFHATYVAFHGYDDDTSVYAPSNLFGVTSYDKGASVLHLLRRILGDEAFFAGLNDYLDAHAYGNASTQDLRAALEGAYGGDLGFFFDPWIYASQAPFPVVQWGWAREGDGLVLGVAQLEDGADFTFPLPIRVTLKDGAVIDADLWIEGAPAQRFALDLGGKVASVEVDPDGWVLGEFEALGLVPGSECDAPSPCTQGDAACLKAVPGAHCAVAAGEGCGGCAHGSRSGGDGAAWALALLGLGLSLARRRGQLLD